jgi:uncharacterized lipoprotein NlpE involved in copper resistance
MAMGCRGLLVALALAAGLAAPGDTFAVAPPAAASQPAAADQAKRTLTGAWRGQVDDPSGSPITMTLTFNADGTYTRVFAGAGGEAPPPATNGTWTVQAMADGRLSVTMVRAGQPAAEARPVVFRVVDNDNLVNESENYRVRRAQ